MKDKCKVCGFYAYYEDGMDCKACITCAKDDGMPPVEFDAVEHNLACVMDIVKLDTYPQLYAGRGKREGTWFFAFEDYTLYGPYPTLWNAKMALQYYKAFMM